MNAKKPLPTTRKRALPTVPRCLRLTIEQSKALDDLTELARGGAAHELDPYATPREVSASEVAGRAIVAALTVERDYAKAYRDIADDGEAKR